MDNLIQMLRKKGWTKWRIAKRMGVTWQTVHMWERETFQPRETLQNQLEALLKEPQ